MVAGFRGGRFLSVEASARGDWKPGGYWSTPARAAAVITKAVLNQAGATGVYYDERGKPMLGSAQVRDPEFQDHVMAQTRALLATVSA